MLFDHIPGDFVKIERDGMVVEILKTDLIKEIEAKEVQRQKELAKAKTAKTKATDVVEQPEVLETEESDETAETKKSKKQKDQK